MLTLYAIYIVCLALVVVYAHDRFGTPVDYRYTTRPGPYWRSYTGYVVCTVLLFFALSFLLTLDAVKQWLLDATVTKETGLDPGVVKYVMSLPGPFAAALAISVLLPKLPVLKDWDERLLKWFREWANIPEEVHQLAKRLQPTDLVPTPRDIEALREFIVREDRVPNNLAEHLRDSLGFGYEQSQYRFTRILHLFAALKRLSGQPRYHRFFGERAAQFEQIETAFWQFATRSEALLTLGHEVDRYETKREFAKLLAELRGNYKQECVAMFKPMADLLAYALLRAEPTDEAVEQRMREIGFASDLPAPIVFPINELSLLAVGLLLLFLLVGGPFAPYLFPERPDTPSALRFEMVGVFIVFAHTLATWVTVRVVQCVGFFHRRPGQEPPTFACLCWAACCGAGSWLLCVGFGVLMGLGTDTPFILPVSTLNFVLALMLSYFCSGGLESRLDGKRLRLAEAAATGLAMAAVGWIVAWCAGMVQAAPPDQLVRLCLVAIALPGLVGLLMGGVVPTIFRLIPIATAQRGLNAVSPVDPPAAAANAFRSSLTG